MSKLVRIGITHGDINGIGYEVMLKTFADLRVVEDCVVTVYGSSKVAGYHRKGMNLEAVPFSYVNHASESQQGKVNFLNCCVDELKVELGKSTEVAGEAAYQSLERATADLKEGFIDVLLTAPINKHNIQNEGFHFPGHTEYLESKFAREGERSLMIMACDNLKVALVTGHIPISEISSALTKNKIVNVLGRFHDSLRRDFGIQHPRIAVLGLNPHAGENGLLGGEEDAIIAPAISECFDKKISAFGPYPADGFFGSGAYSQFDGVLAMYHDQGLIPFKTIAMEEGVNFTAGLPIIRTSPAHGTGYSIAGKGIASPDSFRSALYMAIDVYKRRQWFDESSSDPLRKSYFDKRGAKDESVDLSKDEDLS